MIKARVSSGARLLIRMGQASRRNFEFSVHGKAAHGDDGGTGGFGETSAVDADRPSLECAQRQRQRQRASRGRAAVVGRVRAAQARGMRHATWTSGLARRVSCKGWRHREGLCGRCGMCGMCGMWWCVDGGCPGPLITVRIRVSGAPGKHGRGSRAPWRQPQR